MADTESTPSPTATTPSGTHARPTRTKTGTKGKARTRTRAARPYPASSFSEAAALGAAIHQYASGQRVRRLTLLKQMQKSPTSGPTKQLITNSGKYKITTGSYAAEWIALTPTGSVATEPGVVTRRKLQAQFSLAIEGVTPFAQLYAECKSRKLPSQDVMKDFLREAGVEEELLQECVDTFIVNTKDLGLIQTVGGSETLFPIESRLDDLGEKPPTPGAGTDLGAAGARDLVGATPGPSVGVESGKTDWSRLCFVITAIGEEGSDQRRHADLFLNSLIEPALKESGLSVVRADRIGAAGMITSQVLEHVMRSRLAVVDLSFHNPNAFYEMALRHACGLPIVQVTRKCDKPPFDENQVRTVVVDTSDIYTLVPKLETYRSEIATHVRAALADGTTGNPITVFFPGVKVTIPPEK